MITFLTALILDIPQAQAASLTENLQSAQQIVAEITPAVSSTPLINSEINIIALVPEGYLNKPLIAETKITLNQIAISQTSIKKTLKTAKVKLVNDGKNHFAYGYCTYYVASRRNIPWFGNAGTWLSGARAAGFATGDVPQVGAIIVTSESRWGHVGIVEAVNGDGIITILEMNYSGFARINTRTISTSYGAIKGYIY